MFSNMQNFIKYLDSAIAMTPSGDQAMAPKKVNVFAIAIDVNKNTHEKKNGDENKTFETAASKYGSESSHNDVFYLILTDLFSKLVLLLRTNFELFFNNFFLSLILNNSHGVLPIPTILPEPGGAEDASGGIMGFLYHITKQS